MPPSPETTGRTVDPESVRRFARDSDAWWDENGPFRPLHRLNPVRMRFLRDTLCRHFARDDESFTPFTGLSLLDIGCGGGLVCEPMARLGASVTGIDADMQAIAVARAHAERSGLHVAYTAGAAEDLAAKFDIVLALEIVEHVADRDAFVRLCAERCAPGGMVVFSTLNRTARSFALGIVAAEYLLRWVPRGTHDWKQFVRPSELARSARAAGLIPGDTTGLVFDPVSREFRLSERDIAVNYFLTATLT